MKRSGMLEHHRSAPGSGPGRSAWAPGVPSGAVRGRAHPPGGRCSHPQGESSTLRGVGNAGGVRLLFNPKIPAALIRDLAALRFVDANESVLTYGPVGVGKSHIAQALGHAACHRGCDVSFARCSRVLADLAGGHADGSWEARIRRWAKPKVLILDDFAIRPDGGSGGRLLRADSRTKEGTHRADIQPRPVRLVREA